MKRVTVSSDILHVLNADSKEHTWSGLIFAAQTEIQRIEQRAAQLRDAIKVFRKKEKSGDPVALDSATHN